jgi:hypothetical protein
VLALVAGCTVRAQGRSTVAQPQAVEAFVPPASVRVAGEQMHADLWVRGASGRVEETVRVLLHGPGVRVPSRQTRCRSGSISGTAFCPSIDVDSGRRSGFRVREGTAWEIDPAQLAAGPYTIDVAAGSSLLARFEVSLVTVPSVGGTPRWIVDPVRGARIAHAQPDEWVAWLPIDGRLRGQHDVTTIWYRDGARLRADEATFEGPFAEWQAREGRIELDAPVFELRPFSLGRPPETRENIGTYTVVVVIDHAILAGAWTVRIDPGPIVERGAPGSTSVGMLYQTDVETFVPAFRDPWAFWAELTPVDPSPGIAADALSIQASGAARAREDERWVCAVASDPEAREVLALLGPARASASTTSYGATNRDAQRDVERLERRLDAMARRQSPGCLAALLGPGIGALLLPL